MAKASTELLRSKLLNAIENALAHEEITIEQYETAIQKVQAMGDDFAIINCDNEVYLIP